MLNANCTNMSFGICSAEEAKLIGVKLFIQYGGRPNDPNSFIDLSGVEKIFADVYNIIEQPFKPGPGDCEGMGRVLDVNSDGKISLQDVQALCVRFLGIGDNELQQSVVIEQPVQKVIPTVYDQCDRNKDGFLSQDEIKQLITNTYSMTFGVNYVPTQDEIYQFISANDQFGDGRIIREEFIRQTTYEVLRLKGWI